MRRPAYLPRSYKSRSSSALSMGQRLLLIGYVALFALILPFICWGALAEPGHPHRTPHFVFADPTHNRPAPANKVSSADQHGGVHLVDAIITHPIAICRLQPDDAVAGRATPTLLLFTILLLLLAGSWTCGQIDRSATTCWLQPLLAQARFIAVPLPPPRTLCSITA